MANLNAVVLPAKRLADGSNKVRISIAHNGETKYIVTDIIINDKKEFKNGVILKRDDAAFLNSKIRKLLNKYQSIIDEIDFVESLSCKELLTLVKNGQSMGDITLNDLYSHYIETSSLKESSLNSYDICWKLIKKFVDPEMKVRSLTCDIIMSLEKNIKKRNVSPGYLRCVMNFFHILTNHAVKYDLVYFKKDPWRLCKLPPIQIRQSWISIEQLKKLRDMEMSLKSEKHARDLFMLSFYLGGINLVDVAKLDFKKVISSNIVKYKRTKVENRSQSGMVEFELPEEAKVIMKRLEEWERFKRFNPSNYIDISTYTGEVLRKLRSIIGAENLVFYSARKTFSQIALELGISSHVIDYILGHSVKSSNSCLYHYVYVTPKMATEAIRKVLDFIK